MRLQRWITTFLLLAVLAGGPVQGSAAQGVGPAACAPGEFAPGGVLVALQPAAYPSFHSQRLLPDLPPLQYHRAAVQAAAGDFTPAGWLSTPPGLECATLERLHHDPRVRYAELDYLASTALAPQPDPATPIAPALVTPNDPEWPSQWGPAKVGAPQAWEVVTGTAQTVIAIVDSGMRTTHPDLAPKLWTNPGEIPANQIDDDDNGQIDDIHGWHYYHLSTTSGFQPREDADLEDQFGHGTHVAGIAGAAGNNATGIAGIDWGARLMVIKVLDQYGNGWYSDIAAGIIYAVNNGANIINLSLGGPTSSQVLQDAVQYARARGVLVVGATGNANAPVLYPAAYPEVLAVAATTPQDLRASFSNYGPQVDLAAPGLDIYSTWYLDRGRGPYFTKSGTSMAAPHVSGAAGLVLAQWPELSASEVITRLLGTSQDIERTGPDDLSGWGRLDIAAALQDNQPPDLWARQSAPEVALAAETITLTIEYGNRGSLPSQVVTLTSTLMAPSGTVLHLQSWLLDPLPALSPTRVLTAAISLEPGQVYTAALTSQVTISSPSPEIDLYNNHSQVQVWVNVPPVASFQPSQAHVTAGQLVTFTNTSTGSLPMDFFWSFSDGLTTTQPSPVRAFAALGIYTATLTITNPYGQDRHMAAIEVGAAPTAAFSLAPNPVSVGIPVTFHNQSSGSGPLAYIWDFGNAGDATSTSAEPSYTFWRVGVVPVTLTVTSPFGQAHVTHNIQVGPAQLFLPLSYR